MLRKAVKAIMNRPSEKGQPRLSFLVSMALSNLRFKKLRTALTVMGVVIGIGSIVFLVSLGLGLQNLVTKRVVSSDSVRTIEVASPDPNLVKLNQKAVEQFLTFGGFRNSTRIYSYPASLSLDAARTDSVAYGIDDQYAAVSVPQRLAGEVRSVGDGSVIIGSSLLQPLNMASPQAAIGKTITLNIALPAKTNDGKDTTKNITAQYRVTGVVESGAGTDVYVNASVFERQAVGVYQQVKLVVKDQKAVGDIRKKIEALGFTSSSPIDTLTQINQLFTFFNFILAGFGSIGMIIAILGMLNTLTISLLERTQEIGLIVSLGGTESDIKKLFVSESLILSTAGGVVGIGMAFLGGGIIDLGLNTLARQQGMTETFSVFSLPITLIASVVVFMVVVGLAVVYVPARRAARINPIIALRRE